ncbi:DEAD/DEAH box helicase [Gimesia maris]|uniref:ATP-dependent RNA helicase DeaD n=1 Tax=Gimesia maris TaxID=122 RepID=A0ABX5YR81_9PLAN|nr:DEAD/DEAH box helicase [Gimesia maris]EDL58244.1 ATP-dependent RNA helicase DeaD [Gimesia maris DSM 8797]QDU16056.1 ATP-dependent RNA helicase DeaD [Gimesia maris]QEG18082.1 ATP-dependent RNA helicase DeaD [Gimesia maris]QGQ28903.1 DEAD/DEAH box helicase [Gimesia maris]|tara:strand:- start:154595 stop:156415 length:1821 start_codon:yes stop_codon:yes gene_type:complete
MLTDVSSQAKFTDLELCQPILDVLVELGYDTPTPIQAQTIPHLLEGRDLVGQAQTGTGKTAAFALPLLSKIDLELRAPQVLVLAPTRELAIQVGESFKEYGSQLKGLQVLPIYGGADFKGQLQPLKRGVHVVVGTPGRVMDHMRRGTLKLDNLRCLVLDEADEMLRMGFIDDVEWILEQTPDNHQTALFSATMPEAIRRIAGNYLKSPQEITVKDKTRTADTIRQRYWLAKGHHKLDALTRILEAEETDGVIIFVRTKSITTELSEKLEARGFLAAPLNGDIPQKQRERTVGRLKAGHVNIVIATDVAARGLDVDRISHVINYDLPGDSEAYVHRIGRTGRAGRTGEAIMFVSPREQRSLSGIERAIKLKIERMELPSINQINKRRTERFKESVTKAMDSPDFEQFQKLLSEFKTESERSEIDIAAALACMFQGKRPLFLKETPQQRETSHRETPQRQRDSSGKPQFQSERRFSREKEFKNKEFTKDKEKVFTPRRERATSETPEEGMERFRVQVGRSHGVKPGNIVGAIANEANLDSQYIGRIDIFDEYSTVDLPEGMPRDIFRALKNVWVSGQQLRISRLDQTESGAPKRKRFKSKGKPRQQKA